MPLSFPLDCWVGLAANGVEVVGRGYQRLAATLAATDEGAANDVTLQWPMASGPWGLVNEVQVWDAAAAGNLLDAGPVVSAVDVAVYDRVRIPAGGLLVHSIVVPTSYGTGRFGVGRYGTTRRIGLSGAVLLMRTFETSDPCAAGAWTSVAALPGNTFPPSDVCTAGAWTPAEPSL